MVTQCLAHHSQVKQSKPQKSIPGQEWTCQFIHYWDEGICFRNFWGFRAQMIHCPVSVNAILISIRERQIRFSFTPEHINISGHHKLQQEFQSTLDNA